MNNMQCKRCVMDNSSDPTISFDSKGYCNYCSDALRAKEVVYFPNETGKKKLEDIFDDLKTKRKSYKYDYSYEQIANLIKKYLPAYKLELIKFFKQIVFNYLVGNGDAHIKNFSVIQRETKDYTLSPAYDLLSSSLHIPNESRTALELFKDYDTPAFQANGFYSYDDFIKFAQMIGIDEKIANKIIEEFISYEAKTLDLLEISFLSDEGKHRYKKLYLDRLKAVRYRYMENSTN